MRSIKGFWDWSARWPWFTVLFLTGFTVIVVSEYGLSIVFLLLASLAVFSKLLHWNTEKNSSGAGLLKVIGSVVIWLVFAWSAFSVNEERGNKPWSHLQPPLETLMGNLLLPIPTYNVEISVPSFPPDYSKLEPASYDTKERPDKAPPKSDKPETEYRFPVSRPSEEPPYIRKTAPFFTYVLFNTHDSKIPFHCANSMTFVRIATCGEVRDIINRNFHGDIASVAKSVRSGSSALYDFTASNG